MANHLKNTICPKCRDIGRDKTGNNLGVYDDGSCYCWSCGYYVPPTATGKVSRLSRMAREALVQNQTPVVSLPPDCDVYIPAVARDWLGKYSLTEYEIIHNKLMWSEYWQQLIFPYFDKYNNLVAWQGRSFNPEFQIRKHTKWFSQGDLKSLFHIIPATQNYDSLVLVEDIVSAIKVGRHLPALVLFGNNIANRLVGLYRLTNKLVIWLDPDMKKKTLREADKARQLGFQVSCIFTDKDPKDYSHEDIQICLKNISM